MSKNSLSIFKDKTLLITGGTGSFGNAVVKELINLELKEIRIYSRDEKKQDYMSKYINNKKLNFILGDIRDSKQIKNALNNVDYVFHAAALKQVPSCEFHPMEAIKTNILGTENLLDACIEEGVKKVICLSTDKAVYPINAMGLSKALMEKVSFAKSKISKDTTIATTRFGNVMASRGSVIPLFCQQIYNSKPITVTNPSMTRFMMYLEEAVDLVLYAFKHAKPGELFVQKSPASSIKNLSLAMADIFNLNKNQINVIGTRNGEKLFEVLVSREEMAYAIDNKKYFKIPAVFENMKYENFINQGNDILSASQEYTSNNTSQLSVNEVKNLLLNLPIINSLRNGSIEDYI